MTEPKDIAVFLIEDGKPANQLHTPSWCSGIFQDDHDLEAPVSSHYIGFRWKTSFCLRCMIPPSLSFPAPFEAVAIDIFVNGKHFRTSLMSKDGIKINGEAREFGGRLREGSTTYEKLKFAEPDQFVGQIKAVIGLLEVQRAEPSASTRRKIRSRARRSNVSNTSRAGNTARGAGKVTQGDHEAAGKVEGASCRWSGNFGEAVAKQETTVHEMGKQMVKIEGQMIEELQRARKQLETIAANATDRLQRSYADARLTPFLPHNDSWAFTARLTFQD
ncbi:uncharacterized protein FFNC_15597 [Fusarium fujikuroi]|nr:uncharacterized protein FFNC_15597 [Fusarium fujikuroi]